MADDIDNIGGDTSMDDSSDSSRSSAQIAEETDLSYKFHVDEYFEALDKELEALKEVKDNAQTIEEKFIASEYIKELFQAWYLAYQKATVAINELNGYKKLLTKYMYCDGLRPFEDKCHCDCNC